MFKFIKNLFKKTQPKAEIAFEVLNTGSIQSRSTKYFKDTKNIIVEEQEYFPDFPLETVINIKTKKHAKQFN
jgi:hypothetical protein